MTLRVRIRFSFALLLGFAVSALAEEGMWLPRQLPALAPRLAALGFKGDPRAFADLSGQPMGAIVSLGGCSASFVSPEGLIATNHHCATGALQHNSTPERNLLLDGWLAKTRAEELWNGPGSRVLVTVAIKDVTSAITGDLDPRLDDARRFERIDRRLKERVAACESTGLRCRVEPFFGGLEYHEIAQLEIRDVRTVYAPAAGIGNFGGETDNWRWPRHTGDWSFFRAYVAKDGKPADHSPDNVPYRPSHWLPLARRGAAAGDLVLVAGYPGRTQRLQTAAEVRETTEWSFPRFVKRAEEQIGILEELAKQDPELRVKTASRLRGLNNSLTNRRGMLEGLVERGALAAKERSERELEGWIAAEPGRRRQYGDVLPGLAALQAEREGSRERDAAFAALVSPASLLSAAQTALALAQEREKKDDLDREADYQQRNWQRLRETQQRLQRSLDVRIDRALLRWAMARAAELPLGQRITGLDKLAGLTAGMSPADSGRAIDAYLEGLYARTRMLNLDFRLGLLDATRAELAASGDPFVGLARALDPLRQALREAGRRREGRESRLRPRYVEALLAQAGGLLAPDANGTLRISFGTIEGKPGPDGTSWLPFTTLAGIEQKHTGRGDFAAPPRELAAISELRGGSRTSAYRDDALGDVPVDFLSTADTTGGNSGSPTLNDRGELVGLLFDGTFESVTSDFLHDPKDTRSIHVDARYMLWVMSEVDGAQHLIEEMGRR